MESALRDIAPAGLVVIETLGFTPKGGFARLGLHMDRVEQSCARLGIPFDRAETLFQLGSSVDALPARVRMTIDLQGTVGVTTSELTQTPEEWRVVVSKDVVQSNDPWLSIKSSNRALYDQTRANLPEGVDEVLFCNENAVLCEGTITNVFVQRGDVLLTPHVKSGVLPGVLRQELIESGQAIEADLTVDDLNDAVCFVGNSLRGLIRIRVS